MTAANGACGHNGHTGNHNKCLFGGLSSEPQVSRFSSNDPAPTKPSADSMKCLTVCGSRHRSKDARTLEPFHAEVLRQPELVPDLLQSEKKLFGGLSSDVPSGPHPKCNFSNILMVPRPKFSFSSAVVQHTPSFLLIACSFVLACLLYGAFDTEARTQEPWNLSMLRFCANMNWCHLCYKVKRNFLVV